MQEYWELYMKQIDGKVASVQFNAGISMDMEEMQYTYPTIGFVKVKLKNPSDKGLLDELEEDEILYLEDKLEASLIKFRIGKYVGRIISDGHVTFLYYLQFTYNWQDFLDFALEEHASYEATHGFEDDAQWNYYQKLLYPTVTQWQIIQNHKVCDGLKEAGDTLEKERAIEHKLYFQNEADKEVNKEELTVALEKEGYAKKEDITNEDGIEGFSFFRRDIPHYYTMDEVTLALIELIDSHGASYDGWETSVVLN